MGTLQNGTVPSLCGLNDVPDRSAVINIIPIIQSCGVNTNIGRFMAQFHSNFDIVSL